MQELMVVWKSDVMVIDIEAVRLPRMQAGQRQERLVGVIPNKLVDCWHGVQCRIMMFVHRFKSKLSDFVSASVACVPGVASWSTKGSKPSRHGHGKRIHGDDLWSSSATALRIAG